MEGKRSVSEYIAGLTASGRGHMTLIDPDKQSPEAAGSIARTVEELGTDAIMIGGSTGVSRESMDATVGAIKESCSVPAIIFPTSAGALSPKADAIYFMSLLNSRDIRYIIGEQLVGAPVIRSMDLETISMGYIVVEPGMKVGMVGGADPVPRSDPDLAVSYALCAQLFGMSLVYLEAGSGAPEPVPPEMVARVKEALSIPLIVGGGIRTPEAARSSVEAGADIVVTGTVVEDATHSARLVEVLGPIIGGVKGR